MQPIKGVQTIQPSVVGLGHPVMIRLEVSGAGPGVSVTPIASHQWLGVYRHHHVKDTRVWDTQVVPLNTGLLTIATRTIVVKGAGQWQIPAQYITVVDPPDRVGLLTPPIQWLPLPFPKGTVGVLVGMLVGVLLVGWGLAWGLRRRPSTREVDVMDPLQPPTLALFALMDALNAGYAQPQLVDRLQYQHWFSLWQALLQTWFQQPPHDPLVLDPSEWENRVDPRTWQEIQLIQRGLDQLAWGPPQGDGTHNQVTMMTIREILYRWSRTV